VFVGTLTIDVRRTGLTPKLVVTSKPYALETNLTPDALDQLIAELTREAAQWRAATARDPYQILGVDRGASDAEIKRAYRKMARQHHPDLQMGEAQKNTSEERFKEVNDAYETLRNQDKRQQYDRTMKGGL
jgi:preprotein translocase subunit Sec63